MQSSVDFSIELIDGYRLGKLAVPIAQVADWLNFLINPQYQAEIVSAEQARDRLDIYFQASEGVYLYLEQRLHSSAEWAIAC